MRILGFSGKARHGKDTCAGIVSNIASEFDLNIGTWALAHPLKAIVFGEAAGKYSMEEVWDNKPPAVRKQLQIRGTEEGRMKYGESLWTLQSQAYLELFRRNFPFLHGVTFTDVRFPNEVTFIQAGGIDVASYSYAASVRYMIANGFEQYLEKDPEEENHFSRFLECEQRAILFAQEFGKTLINKHDGLALYISSDRPTLEGEAALHTSETALDHLDKDKSFDGVIINNMDTTLEDLKEQLTPYVRRLFDI